MILVDVNLLIYAYNRSDRRFPKASKWFEGLLNADVATCFCWETVNGFLRVSTNASAMPVPMSLHEAFDVVETWLEAASSVFLKPSANHFDILKRTSIEADARGKRYSDAVLAAYAISHDATFATTDKHFRMFTGLRIIDPIAD
ncbi:MAG: TA system VapC family ribonuclease toxin [Pyrinomonadaceae bacterium]